FGWALRSLSRHAHLPFTAWSAVPLLTLLLVCGPLRQQVAQGQLFLILLALVTGIWLADRKGRQILAGALLALAISLAVTPVVLLLYFPLRRRWRAATGTLLGLLLINLAPGLVLGARAYPSYLTSALVEVERCRGSWDNLSLPALWYKLFAPAEEYAGPGVRPLLQSPSLALTGALASCILLGALAARRTWQSKSR